VQGAGCRVQGLKLVVLDTVVFEDKGGVENGVVWCRIAFGRCGGVKAGGR
jgi:hypothetical protein